MKQRRAQREAEKAAQEEELSAIQRERAIAEAVQLEKKEEEVGRSFVMWFYCVNSSCAEAEQLDTSKEEDVGPCGFMAARCDWEMAAGYVGIW